MNLRCFLHLDHEDLTPPAGNFLLLYVTKTSQFLSLLRFCLFYYERYFCVGLVCSCCLVPFSPPSGCERIVFIKNQITGERIDRSLAAVNHLTVAQRGQQLHSSVSTPRIKYEQSEKQSRLFFKCQERFASIYYLITLLFYEF